MKQLDQCAKIRAELLQVEGCGPAKRYPKALRRRVISYYGARRAQGVELGEIAQELGLRWRTLDRWVNLPASAPLVPTIAPGFERVEVRDAPLLVTRDAIVVRGPAGLCIEGLDMDGLVELIRRLS